MSCLVLYAALHLTLLRPISSYHLSHYTYVIRIWRSASVSVCIINGHTCESRMTLIKIFPTAVTIKLWNNACCFSLISSVWKNLKSCDWTHFLHFRSSSQPSDVQGPYMSKYSSLPCKIWSHYWKDSGNDEIHVHMSKRKQFICFIWSGKRHNGGKWNRKSLYIESWSQWESNC